ncbi:hypothetical protein FGKAn22_12390 [Ferrigenium kumadai]|uniref:Uncharacterized protein n=1 Tax=Ferrigenium kumadai TaxID=1682490 RepID=A0AAN1W0D8_9PROT|nr:hypothetical protein [Ferrigenium kumadai]BBI99546.1 hypothetical protein FGKAn22_12390 [Ferrigenium kumadai]
MLVVSIIFSFCLGMLAGYQLPVWLEAWRTYRRHKTFRLTVLEQYMPQSGQQGKSGS